MILGLLLSLAFDPLAFQGATTPKWALLAVALPVMVSLSSPNHFSRLHLIGAGFLAWCVLSLTWTSNLWDGFGLGIHLIILSLAFVLGSRSESLAAIFKGLALGLTVSSLLVVIPHDEFSTVLTSEQGLFGNQFALAEVAALTIIGCVVYRLWWFIPGVIPSLVPLHSQTTPRSALLGLGVAGLAWLWSRSRVASLSLAALVCAAAIASAFYRPESSWQRVTIWQDTLAGLSFFGHGLGSFFTDFVWHAANIDTSFERPEHAHNELLEWAFELGAVGLVLFCAFWWQAYRTADLATRCLIAGVLAIGMVSFPFHVPATAFVGSLCAGHACRVRRGIRAQPRARGISLSRWAYAWLATSRTDRPSTQGSAV